MVQTTRKRGENEGKTEGKPRETRENERKENHSPSLERGSAGATRPGFPYWGGGGAGAGGVSFFSFFFYIAFAEI